MNHLVGIITEQAKLRPEATALAMESSTLSYGELEECSSQLANHLRALGVRSEVLVAICLPRSPEFVVAALGILKCGGAYLPIDPAHPAERSKFIIEDAGARLILTRESASLRRDLLPQVQFLNIDDPAIAQSATTSPALHPNSDDLAYVIYTSGSTGQPKGVEITHRNLANLIAWHLRAFALDSSARATFQAGVGFDAAVWEIWPALSVGAELHLPNEETRVSPEAVRDWIVTQQITHSFVPTAIAEQLLALPWPNETKLRFLLTGADTLHRFPPAGLPFALINNYGPTECTVVATSVAVAAAGEGIPSIGAAIDNVSVQIIDDEIHIGGAGVARGYRNQPALTAESFIQVKGERVYRTGDLGRILPSGEIEFLGRRDDQVKIRGCRIELNEIDAALNQHPSVKTSLVLAREDSPNEKKLVAYVVPSSSFHDEKALREALAQRLPDYMIPSAFVFLESLPLNANGKVDRAALPAPSANEGQFIAPRTPVEETLAAIIAEVLKLPRVGIDEDFFHLGAHSLLGAQVIARIRADFGIELKLLDVFDAPTVSELSVRIEEALARQLEGMSDAEVEAALASFSGK